MITDAEIVELLLKCLNSMPDDGRNPVKVLFVMDIFGRRFEEVLERAREAQ